MYKKTFLLMPLLAAVLSIFAQPHPAAIDAETLRKKIAASNASLEETQRKLDSGIKARTYQLDSAANARNMNGLTTLMRERNKAEKKKAYRNIFIGAGFLAILIIGLMRKRKKQPTNL